MVKFVALGPDRATLDWVPKPMTVTVITHGGMDGKDLTLNGTEIFGYRIDIDPRTGTLIGAAMTNDNLHLRLGLPDGRIVPINITREITIAPRKDA